MARTLGAKNKSAIKARLKEIAFDYVTPCEREDEEGNVYMSSQFEEDLQALKNPKDRINSVIGIMEFVEPKLRSTDAHMEMDVAQNDRIARILGSVGKDKTE